jgi:hypothetical protein
VTVPAAACHRVRVEICLPPRCRDCIKSYPADLPCSTRLARLWSTRTNREGPGLEMARVALRSSRSFFYRAVSESSTQGCQWAIRWPVGRPSWHKRQCPEEIALDGDRLRRVASGSIFPTPTVRARGATGRARLVSVPRRQRSKHVNSVKPVQGFARHESL